MAKTNVLLLCGGGGSEHDISLMSARHIEETLKKLPHIEIFFLEIKSNHQWLDKKQQCWQLVRSNQWGKGLLLPASDLQHKESSQSIDFIIPCIHGPPGETGDIQSFFELIGVPYLGVRPEASMLCFNKISTKLWFDALGIKNTPYAFLNNLDQMDRAFEFFDQHSSVFVKASSQGSSIGVYPVEKKEELKKSVEMAFTLSDYVLLEKKLKVRELEVAAFDYQGKLHLTHPAEIIAHNTYSFEEKYSSNSQSKTQVKAQNLSPQQLEDIHTMAQASYKGLKLRHLSRIDFFLTHDNHIYLNEINTFPGMTPISQFPKMMEAYGVEFSNYLDDIIQQEMTSIKKESSS